MEKISNKMSELQNLKNRIKFIEKTERVSIDIEDENTYPPPPKESIILLYLVIIGLMTFISSKFECSCSSPSFFCKLNNLTFFILEIFLKYFIENDLPSSFEYELPCQHIPILKLS